MAFAAPPMVRSGPLSAEDLAAACAILGIDPGTPGPSVLDASWVDNGPPWNASLGQWLTAAGHATAPYTASQGAALGRDGRIYVERDADGTIWVGGDTVTCVQGTVDI